MFLIGAFIIAVSIILLKISVKSPGIEGQLNLMEMTMENDIASNLRQELGNSAKFSIDQKENITTNVFDFANFAERRAAEHGLEFEFLFVGSYANVSNNYLNVSVINMLSKPINASLNLNGTIMTSEISDSSRWDTNFTFTPGSLYVLTIEYNSTHVGNVTISTKHNKDIYVAFFDTTLKTLESTYTNKTQETYKLK
jgi:hypothetical protein